VGLPGGPRPNSALHMGYSHVVCSSPDIVDHYAEAFSISNERVHPLGVPRFSSYFIPDFQEKAKLELQMNLEIPSNKQIVLIAPTFRGNGQKSAYSSDLLTVVDELAKVFKKSHEFLIRDHPFAFNRSTTIPSKLSNVHYVSNPSYQIEKLVAGSNILVTDYSSVVFEFALLNKPTILFVPDRMEYQDTRGLYYPLDEYAYGNMTTTLQQLIEAIKDPNIDFQQLERIKKRHLSSCRADSANLIFEKLIAPKL